MSTLPAVQDSQMVLSARGLLAQKFETQEMVQARAAAETLIGIVIMGEAEAAAVTDALVLIARAKKQAKASLDEVLELPKKVTRAVTEDFNARVGVLLRADKEARAALDAYNTRREREAASLARIATQAASDAAEAEARRISESATPGEEVFAPPPVVITPPKANGAISGGSGTAVRSTRVKCEMAGSPGDVPHDWLQLNESQARMWMEYEEKCGRVDRLPIGKENAIVKDGVRFWRESSIAVRAR